MVFVQRSRGFIAVALLALGSVAACTVRAVSMPGTSYAGPEAQPDPALVARLNADVTQLAAGFGERNVTNQPAALEQTAAWLRTRLEGLGYVVQEEPIKVGERTTKNLIVERRGRGLATQLVLVGAHYDTAHGTPGADDNGSGVAVALALAEIFSTRTPERTVRFIFFTNEEPPHFRTTSMGSVVNAGACRGRHDDVKAMLSLETLGYFSDEAGSQRYPWPLSLVYPSQGNFVAFVGNVESRELVRDCVRTFRAMAQVPSEGASLPGSLEGVDFSDHAPYWKYGYPALMVTDTALFRNPHYHEPTDVPARVDFRRLALVTEGLISVVESLAQ